MRKGKSNGRQARHTMFRRMQKRSNAVLHPARIHDLKYNRNQYDGCDPDNQEAQPA